MTWSLSLPNHRVGHIDGAKAVFKGGVTTENISVFYNPYMFLFIFYVYCAYYCGSNIYSKFELCIVKKIDKSSLRS